MKLRHLLLVVSALVMVGRPAAADSPGWYGGVGAGPALSGKINGTGDLDFNSGQSLGFAALGFGGYSFGALHLEGELGYRRFDVRSLNIVSDNGLGNQLGVGSLTGASGRGGSLNALSTMFNTRYDFLPKSDWTPYIGLGLGLARVGVNGLSANGVPIADHSDFRPAYQGIVGVSYALSPKVSLALDYRYFATFDNTIRDSGGGSIRVPLSTHNVILSAVYHFGAPGEPTATPAPAHVIVAEQGIAPVAPVFSEAPEAAERGRTFLVFFDLNDASLTPGSRRVIEQAAKISKASRAARLDVGGYTDSSGSAQHNLELSQRRADMVHRYLVSLGVPADAITEGAHGKEDLRVPTPDGVREAQNRRVEIVLR